jgi:ABC-type transport system involved in multi-copper enzyme maturation permease subunit
MSGTAGGTLRRFQTVFVGDLASYGRRPLFWIWAFLLAMTAWGMSSGQVRIQSGDATVGGTKAFITSEFAVAMQLGIVTLLFYGFFVAVVAGMAVIQDEQWGLGELLHSTPLRPGEYIWGKFTALLSGFAVILVCHLAAMVFCNHVVPNSEASEIRGPLHAINYLRPALLFSVPTIVFLAGVSFALGEWTRRPVLVFLLPVAILLPTIFFLWEWSPSWLDPKLNDVLMWVDPAGYRWLNETWLKVDRGVRFYNNEGLPPDRGFLISRVVFFALGLVSVAWSRHHFAAKLRGVKTRALTGQATGVAQAFEARSSIEALPTPLPSLGMTTARPGLLGAAWEVAKVELTELRYSPGLYLFVPLILLETLGSAMVEVGFLDTPFLVTSGTFAVNTIGTLATCLCLLLMFYTVESLERERSSRLAAIAFATPIRSASLFLGKSVAMIVVGLSITLAVAIAGVLVLLFQWKAGFELRPFLLVWGLLLAPTVIVWTAVVLAIHTIVQNRYTTYALCLAILCFTGYRALTNQINWVGNWPLWQAVRWSDISVLELDRNALILSRVFAVSTAIFLVVLTLTCFRRRDLDSTRILHRLSPLPLFRSSLKLFPWVVIPLVALTWLALEVSWGREGGRAKKQEKDYWRKNLATYRDARVPDLSHVSLDLELFPETSRYRVTGTFELKNPGDQRLEEILLTGGLHWEKLAWTMNGQACLPTDRAHLYVFNPPKGSLAPGEKIEIGFAHEGSFPRGISKRAMGSNEFILPSAVVLTSFEASIVPVIGFKDSVGIDDENRQDPKEFRDNYYVGQTDSFVGTRAPFTTEITVTGPADFTLNSVGTKISENVSGGRRKVLWKSDYPVSFFNVIAGRWKIERGDGTVVFYDSKHRYNIGEMREALDAARRYYSEWFYPYPWRELKLSEFPNLASYAQGFPTNITFSEGIGFLTQSSPEIHAAFEITSHEAAHQWWGNLLSPGKGPGGNILSEGTSHFSTILLVEQAKGLQSRIDFCKRIEASYGKSRQMDSERPLVKIDGEKPGDTTVTYDKAGWVFWMLLNHMGRDRALAGIQGFMKAYQGNPDHPVLQDFIASMRPFAADRAAFDAFTQQWFFEVVVPEYKLHDPKKTERGEFWDASARVENVGTGEMPVEVAATCGERFNKDGSASSEYKDTRATVVLGKADSKDVTIRCPFEPAQIVVDPDAKVLQLRRKSAVAKL